MPVQRVLARVYTNIVAILLKTQFPYFHFAHYYTNKYI